MKDDAIARDAITSLLKGDLRNGPVLDRLLPLVYDELRVMARRHLLGEHENHTLNTTGLVHEAYLKLVDQTWASGEGRGYFYRAASVAVPQMLSTLLQNLVGDFISIGILFLLKRYIAILLT